MPSYFRQIPELEYPSRAGDAQISDYVRLKNLFKRATIREDIFSNLMFFTKYQIQGNDRPDNVAYKVYGDETLDWLILITNNIINIQTEWPLTQEGFHNHLLEKYGSEAGMLDVHHYETIAVKNTVGQIMIPKGIYVPEDFVAKYYDPSLKEYIERRNVVNAITNYAYEDELQTKKRNIYVLRNEYLNVILDDIEDIMAYKVGSSQFINRNLIRTENTRLYD